MLLRDGLWFWQGQIILFIFSEIDGAPITTNNGGADLRRALAAAGLLVGVKDFFLADVTARAVLADIAIEQAAMADGAIAVTIAGLLINDFPDASGKYVSVERELIGVNRGIDGRG